MIRMSLKSALVASTLVAGAAAVAVPAAAFADPMVGGAAMYSSKNIVQNAMNSKDHTTLVTAVKAAGLVNTLEGPGPFTVFAPTNKAFDQLPAGTVNNLLKPDNKAKLTSILEYHVVPGKLTTKDLREKIKDGHGKAMLKTVDGTSLTAEEHDGRIELMGAKGSHATITIPNVDQSNGMIQVIDGVLLPS
jgi:uncharacterized surface protein with fasciclin (FAS1) repeats